MSPRLQIVYRVLITALILVYLINPAHTAFLQTLGDFLSLGANTVREIQELIPQVSGETRALLQALSDELNQLIETLSETYQDNLNITLNSLDTLTRDKILEVETQIDNINQLIQDNINLASQEAQNILREAREQITLAGASLEESLKNVVIVGGETAVFVIDRTFYNVVTVVSMILLGVGLLVFVWSLFRQKLPESGLTRTLILAFMGAYLVIFFAIAFIPSVRGAVMTNTGLGLKQTLEKEELVGQPRLLRIIPETITIGSASELQVWGSSLLPEGQSPAAKIGTRDIPLTASSNQQLVFDVTGLNSESTDGSRNVILTYPNNQEQRGIIRLIKIVPTPLPPDLTISSFTLSPSNPLERDNVTATITVLNQGGPAGQSFLKWLPCADLTQAVAQQRVAALNANEPRTLTINFAYPSARSCQSVAIIDENGDVNESNEANNRATRNITIRQPPTPTPIPPSNKFEVTIRTGDVSNAGTDADVFITLFGDRNSSQEFLLDTPGRDDFERGNTDRFSLNTGLNIGTLNRIRLRHDNSGFFSGWFVSRVTIRNVDTGATFTFTLNRWLATDEDDRRIDLFLTPD